MTKYRFDRDDHYLWIPVTEGGRCEFDVPDDILDRYIRAYAELALTEDALKDAISNQPGYTP